MYNYTKLIQCKNDYEKHTLADFLNSKTNVKI